MIYSPTHVLLRSNDAPVACNAWCELVLSLRSVATVLAFFSHAQHRGYLRDWRTLVRRGRLRVRASLGCRGPSGGDGGDGRSGRIQFHGEDRIEEVKLVNRIDVRLSYNEQPKLDLDGCAESDDEEGSAVPYQLMEGDGSPA